jgi:hypothetical protein
MKLKTLELIIVLLFLMLASEAVAYRPLDDQQLNAITAGNIGDYDGSESLLRIPLSYSHKNIDVEGDIVVLPMDTYNNTSTLQLFDNAQSNLRSLININAVNSPINVLLNLNINVNSNIDKIIQLNSLLPD